MSVKANLILIGKKLEEIIYVAINEAMPGYTKIGHTTNLEARIKSLDNTSTPLPFEVIYAAIVENAKFVEQKIHDAFSDHRVRSNREFFEISPERVIAVIKLVESKEVTPFQYLTETEEDKHALEKARERRSAFNFHMVDIKPGSILTFTKDPAITCKVIDHKYIELEGEIMSVSATAIKALNSLGYTHTRIQGPICWQYENETLDERRKRMEEG